MTRPAHEIVNVASFGYAVFLSISVTSIWGGVFPYFADEWRTADMTVFFYVAQIAATAATFAAFLATSWFRPKAAERVFALGFSIPLAAGPLLLLASMYLSGFTPALVIAGAVLTGVGSAGFLASWQRVFASMEAFRGTSALIAGTTGSAFIYFCICFIPAALVAYLIPLVMVPLAGLCLWLAAGQTNVAQPMFEDVPRQHSTIYRNVLRESLLPALSVGALGFCSGAVRFLAISHQELQSIINIVSMATLLVIFAAFFAIWRTRTITFSLTTVFRILFPLTATCLVVLPFAGNAFTNACAAIAYSSFMLATVLMMMHCAQISRDSGINPLFIYAFYGFVAYALQMLGYLTGSASHSGLPLGVEQLSLVSLTALFLMLMVSLFGRRPYALHTDRLEFLAPSKSRATRVAGDPVRDAAVESADRITGEKDAPGADPPEENPERNRPAAHDATSSSTISGKMEDRTALRCRKLAEEYGLSSRETEVAELIARGYTGPAIAEMLFISENTMRTHNRRIYTKLGIHKKQELLLMIEKMGD